MFDKIHQLSDREYRAVIGMSQVVFDQLTVVFRECDQQLKKEAYEAFQQK